MENNIIFNQQEGDKKPRVKDKTPRTFGKEATRDTVQGKLSYVKALSPIALRAYVEYLDKHRTMPDGSLRDFDNWKKGIPDEVCLDSLGRHGMAVWLLMQRYTEEDNHGRVTLEDSLCGVIFNAFTMLHNLKEREIVRIPIIGDSNGL